MRTISKTDVFYHGMQVGTLAQAGQDKAVFQYAKQWLSNGFSISPLSLPLEDKLFVANREPFAGMFGVFDDCLPDGWGRLLTDRYLNSIGIAPETINTITRLSLLSYDSLGALEFRPSQFSDTAIPKTPDFDEIQKQCEAILADKEEADLDTMFTLGGSSGGARPKAHVTINGESWIVKFPASTDSPDIGLQEYQYMQMAKECGLDVPETRLIPSKLTSGFFAVKRFDRCKGQRIHMVSAGGLLEASHRLPCLDYEHLFKLLSYLTKNNRKQLERLFTLMCFNEYAHNRDDHAKNFSFLYTQEDGWALSPAYDLTYSSSLNGEHATTINGMGKTITDSDILAAGTRFLDKGKCLEIMDRVKSVC